MNAGAGGGVFILIDGGDEYESTAVHSTTVTLTNCNAHNNSANGTGLYSLWMICTVSVYIIFKYEILT